MLSIRLLEHFGRAVPKNGPRLRLLLTTLALGAACTAASDDPSSTNLGDLSTSETEVSSTAGDTATTLGGSGALAMGAGGSSIPTVNSGGMASVAAGGGSTSSGAGGAPASGTNANTGGVGGVAGTTQISAAGSGTGGMPTAAAMAGAAGDLATGGALQAGGSANAAGSDAVGGSGGIGGMPQLGVAGTSMGGGVALAGASNGGTGGASTYNPCPTDGAACKILPFGDSITDGYNIPGGYRIELFRKARADSKNFTFVGNEQNGPTTIDGAAFPRAHEGHSGWKIDQIADLVPSPAFDDDPDIVLLMIGTNDVIQNDNLNAAPGRLRSLLEAIQTEDPQALVLVALLTPLEGDSGTRVGPYNTALPGVVEQRAAAGQHLLLVDMFTGFPLGELADGIHPNEAGYARMADVWYQAIADLLP